ncbi:MAG TPA: DUF378 domain-containing protein [Clostridia bacterium]|nr:DUF378 domain-containing protein [Clostridia bacterium]
MFQLALALMVIGALNWLLVGLFQYDLVAAIFGGTDAIISRIIYTIVGIAGIYGLFRLVAGEPVREQRES